MVIRNGSPHDSKVSVKARCQRDADTFLQLYKLNFFFIPLSWLLTLSRAKTFDDKLNLQRRIFNRFLWRCEIFSHLFDMLSIRYRADLSTRDKNRVSLSPRLRFRFPRYRDSIIRRYSGRWIVRTSIYEIAIDRRQADSEVITRLKQSYYRYRGPCIYIGVLISLEFINFWTNGAGWKNIKQHFQSHSSSSHRVVCTSPGV